MMDFGNNPSYQEVFCKMKKVLICGESYMGYTVHIKGADSMCTSGYFENVGWLRSAVEKAGYEVAYMPSNLALSQFPDTVEKLQAYDLVILSDIGANSLMMTDLSFRQSLPAPDRCVALRDYVKAGGALIMVGGFMSFTGIEGKARYGSTPLAEVFPVQLLPYDDRVEMSSGVIPQSVEKDHPILRNMPEPWSYFIGYNKTIADPERGRVIATINNDPLIAVREYGKGRCAVFTSDCAPHWAPKAFLESNAYAVLWKNMVDWACRLI